MKWHQKLVVEIFSPSETWKEIEDKIDEYFAAGVKWIWVVNPKNRHLIIYQGDKEPKKLRENDTLIGEDILSGFELKISKNFADKNLCYFKKSPPSLQLKIEQ